MTTTPASESSGGVCYAVCNNAYIVAESLASNGTTDEFCSENQGFMVEFKLCAKCMTEENDTSFQRSAQLAEFVDSCLRHQGFTAVTGTFVLAGGSTSTIIYYSSPMPTTALASNTAMYGSNTATPSASSATTDISFVSGSIDKLDFVWPLVGTIAGLGCLVTLTFVIVGILRRIRARKKDSMGSSEENFGKAQLHSECIPKQYSEMDEGAIHELEGSLPLAKSVEATAEKPANEVPAKELPVEGMISVKDSDGNSEDITPLRSGV